MGSYQMIKLMPESEWNVDNDKSSWYKRDLDESESSEDVLQKALSELMETDHTNAYKGKHGQPAGSPSEYRERVKRGEGPIEPEWAPELEHSAVDDLDLSSYRPVKCHRKDPLLDACLWAYYNHQPIVFSPDLVYGYLAKGIASHINKFPEQLRKLYVNHDGKKSLVYKNDSFVQGNKDNDWSLMFQDFADQLKTETKGKCVVQNELKFSTSTRITAAHRNVLAMESMKSYFEYRFLCHCGTACVILEGTAEDWQLLRKTVTDQLTEINNFCEENTDADSASLSWWSPIVELLLQNFVDSYGTQEKGEELSADLKLWWGAMFKHSAGMASQNLPEYVTGWINALFPYLVEDRQNPWILHWSPLARDVREFYKRLQSAREDRESTTDKWEDENLDEIIVSPREYKSYSVSVPFTWLCEGENFVMRAVIGYCILAQVATDGAVYPKGTLKLFPAWVIYYDD